jgi:hypothetical protein
MSGMQACGDCHGESCNNADCEPIIDNFDNEDIIEDCLGEDYARNIFDIFN